MNLEVHTMPMIELSRRRLLALLTLAGPTPAAVSWPRR